MKQLLAVLALILVPTFAQAVSDEQWGFAREISQRWVEEHNNKLKDLVKKASELGVKEGKSFVIASKGMPELARKKLDVGTASDYGIPSEVTGGQGVTVNLMKLYRTNINFVPGGEHAFLTADYYDELDPIHSVTDLYIQIGHKYMPLFHGEGYPHSIRMFWLDQTEGNAPLFFEVGQYGGGSRIDKTLYTLNKGQIAAVPQLLFDKPETIEMKDFICKKLSWSVWLSGETSYRDLAGDDKLEVVNVSQAPYPDDLKLKLKKKYGFVNTDFTRSFRKTLSVYQWNDEKQEFDNLGDLYY